MFQPLCERENKNHRKDKNEEFKKAKTDLILKNHRENSWKSRKKENVKSSFFPFFFLKHSTCCLFNQIQTVWFFLFCIITMITERKFLFHIFSLIQKSISSFFLQWKTRPLPEKSVPFLFFSSSFVDFSFPYIFSILWLYENAIFHDFRCRDFPFCCMSCVKDFH